MFSFVDFGLISSLLKTLKDNKLKKPTEIQANVIPLMMSGQSVVGVSETGSGKTLAYALPLLHLLKTLEDEGSPVTEISSPRGVILVPTRELGEQVSKVFKLFTHDTRLRVRTTLGGTPLEQARRNTEGVFEILLATPGRIVQMLEKNLLNLSDVRMLIFDEADQMMDQGFLKDSNTVIDACPKDFQLALFSATISTTVQELINDFFGTAEIIRSKGSGKIVSTLTTKNMIVKDGLRWPIFEKLLAHKVEYGTMVFTNTREQCDKLAKEITEKGHECVIYRGEMDPNERRQNLRKFRDGKINLLISTDLAGRGLDIENVGRVINFHLPKQMENYLHRVGRTARAGRQGLVVNLVTERDERLVAKIEGRKPVPYKTKIERAKDKKTALTKTSSEFGSKTSKGSKPEFSFSKDSKKSSQDTTKNFSKSKPSKFSDSQTKSQSWDSSKTISKKNSDFNPKFESKNRKSNKEEFPSKGKSLKYSENKDSIKGSKKRFYDEDSDSIRKPKPPSRSIYSKKR